MPFSSYGVNLDNWKPIKHLCYSKLLDNLSRKRSLAFKHKYESETNVQAYNSHKPGYFIVDCVYKGNKKWEDEVYGWEAAKKDLFFMIADINTTHQ